jgi:ABC-type dipeptide/oligopeptide/nickel transport system permease component
MVVTPRKSSFQQKYQHELMFNYIIKRLLAMIPVLIGFRCCCSSCCGCAGDPAQVLAGQMASPEEIETIRRQLD